MVDKKLIIESIEPLLTHRFMISSVGVEIPSKLFRRYKLYNEGENLIFTTAFMETISPPFIFNPKDFFNITGFIIEYLDPTGVAIKTLAFDVKGSNFEKECDYADDGKLSEYDMRFIVNVDSLKLV